jgi:hypothetical protein
MSHSRAPRLVGEVRTRGQRIGREEEGRERHQPRRPLPGPRSRRGRTDSFLGERYRRIARRRGKRKAIVAVGCSILVIIWYLLSDPSVRYADLGPGFYDSRISNSHEMRGQIRRPEARLPVTPLTSRFIPPGPAALRWYWRAPSWDR